MTLKRGGNGHLLCPFRVSAVEESALRLRLLWIGVHRLSLGHARCKQLFLISELPGSLVEYSNYWALPDLEQYD